MEGDVNHRADARRKDFCSKAGSERERPRFFTTTVVATSLASLARLSSSPTSPSARKSPPPAVRARRPVRASGAKTGPSRRMSRKFGEILILHCQSVGKAATCTDRLLSSLEQTPPTCPRSSASSVPRHGGHVRGRREREEAEGRTQRGSGRGGKQGRQERRAASTGDVEACARAPTPASPLRRPHPPSTPPTPGTSGSPPPA